MAKPNLRSSSRISRPSRRRRQRYIPILLHHFPHPLTRTQISSSISRLNESKQKIDKSLTQYGGALKVLLLPAAPHPSPPFSSCSGLTLTHTASESQIFNGSCLPVKTGKGPRYPRHVYSRLLWGWQRRTSGNCAILFVFMLTYVFRRIPSVRIRSNLPTSILLANGHRLL